MDGQNPVRVLNLFTILNRGGAETMVMNYYRHIDRTRVQFDFLVHREERGAYEDEIESLGGRIFRMMPVRPWTAGAYRRAIRVFFFRASGVPHPARAYVRAGAVRLSGGKADGDTRAYLPRTQCTARY